MIFVVIFVGSEAGKGLRRMGGFVSRFITDCVGYYIGVLGLCERYGLGGGRGREEGRDEGGFWKG